MIVLARFEFVLLNLPRVKFTDGRGRGEADCSQRWKCHLLRLCGIVAMLCGRLLLRGVHGLTLELPEPAVPFRVLNVTVLVVTRLATHFSELVKHSGLVAGWTMEACASGAALCQGDDSLLLLMHRLRGQEVEAAIFDVQRQSPCSFDPASPLLPI